MHVVQPSAARQIAYLTKEEVERFFAAIPSRDGRDRLLFDVMYRYGLRREEAAIIRREHVGARIWITRLKGGISGEYPIHPTTRRLMWEYFEQLGDDTHPFLFVTRQSARQPMSTSTIYHLFREFAAAACLPIGRRHPHVLRHSIAVHLMNAGWDVADVQDWLGHRDITSTMVYAAITNKRREAKYEESLLSDEIAANNLG
jgi:site-specific recombinase XerD